MVNHNLAYKFHDLFEVEDIKIKETPLKWTTISLSDVLVRGKRLEASVFDVEAKQARDIVFNGKCMPLLGEDGLIKEAYYPGRFKRMYCSKLKGEGFYIPSQMIDIYPKAEKFISKNTEYNLQDLKLKRNTLLLTRSGTIGKIAIVSKTIEGKIFSDDVIRVTFKNEIDLGYAYAFLKSKLGNLILCTNGYGSVITHLEPEHLKEIFIPETSLKIKEKIHNLIMRSYQLRDESNELIDTATNLLINELELPPIEEFWSDSSKSVETFDVKLSDIDKRVDASYHVPIVNKIIGHLHQKAKEVIDVGDERISKSVILPGRFKRIYVDEGYGRIFVGGKQLGELDPSNKKYLSFVHHGKRIEDQLELHENMTLITCSGTIGKVTLVGKHWEKWAANQHIIRIIPVSKDIAGYLNIFLQSDYGYYLITRFTYGSVVDEIDDNHVRQIPIPILKNPIIQQQINDLALQSNEKRYEAYKLEQEALRIMNEEVIYAK